LITVILYSGALRFGFVYDDNTQIVLNPLIKTPRTFTLLFTTDVWRFQNPLVLGNYWRPMFMWWLMLNYSLFKLNPLGWHAMAILAHMICVYLGFRLALRLTTDKWLAALSAIIFAVHPTHIETVAWISGATDSLMCIFLFGSLLAFIHSYDSHRASWISVSLLLYAAALLTKETAIIEPAFVAAYVLLYRNRSLPLRSQLQSASLTLLPFVIVSVLYMVRRNIAVQGFSHPYINMPLLAIIATAPSILFFYVRHLLWPVDLSVAYDSPPIIHYTFTNFWGPLLFCIASVTAIAVYLFRTRDRAVAFSALVLLLPLLPVLYIPALERDSFLHDRYLYLPCIGFSILLATAIRKLPWKRGELFGMPALQVAVAATIAILFSTAAAAQQPYWSNDLVLFHHAVEIAPANSAALNNLGLALSSRGRMQEAMFAFEESARHNPKLWFTQYNLGLGNFLNGNYSKAEVYLQKAVELEPTEGDPAAVLAETYIKEGKFAPAENAIRHAIAVRPYKPGYRRVLALSLEGQGKLPEAVRAAQEELQRQPQDQESMAVLKRLTEEQGRNDTNSRPE
jgi:Flp pilus assembly protein TadD